MPPENSSVNGDPGSNEVEQETQASTPQVVARRAAASRPRSVAPAEIAQLNRICKSIALGALLVVVSVGLFSRFYAAQFSYLEAPAALAQGDIAKRLHRGKGFITGIAPLVALDKKAGTNLWQDATYNPVYPVALAIFFRLRGATDASMALFNGLVHLATALLVYLITIRLRGPRTAILAIVLYSLSTEAIRASLNATGITVAAFFVTAGIWAALKTNAAQALSERKSGRWAAFTGVLFALAYLSGGLTVLLFIPALIMVGFNEKRRIAPMVIMTAAFLVVLLPWVARNMLVFGTLSPLACQYKLIALTSTLPGMSVLTKLPGQVPAPLMFAFSAPGEMAVKFANGLANSLYLQIPSLLNIYIFPFLLLAGLWAAPGSALRRSWTALAGMVALQVVIACLYDWSAGPLQAFMPVGLCIATITVVSLITTQLQKPAARWIAIATLVGIAGFPYASTLVLGEKPTPLAIIRQIAPIRQCVAGDALIATDIPAALSWYTGVSTVLLPPRADGLQDYVAKGADPDYVYFSEKMYRAGPGFWKAYMGNTKAQAAIIGYLREFSDKKDIPPLYERHPKLAPGVGVVKMGTAAPKAPGQAPPTEKSR